MTTLVVLAVAVLAAVAAGLVLRSRDGRVRPSTPAMSQTPATPTADAADERLRALAAAGVAATGRPIVLHFSASWCGPCAAVRRVVAQVLAKLDAAAEHPPAATEIELDIDENPSLAKILGVLSLPTTFILDAALIERFRIAGVPTAADLETSIETVVTCGDSQSR